MKKTELFIFAIKIIGIILFLWSINSLKELSMFFFTIQMARETVVILPSLIIFLLIQWILAYFLLFRTEIIINLLKLKDENQQEILQNSQFNYEKIFQIALLILGLAIIILNIPDFILSVIKNMLLLRKDEPYQKFLWNNFDIHGLKIILGVLLIFNSKKISNYSKLNT
ncbi:MULTISPECIES: hypothetical protein [Sphingobacterium]|uniref:DUF2975 domain-containing protein n=1 Tax=Sphingobacterium tenebrionis TaxID=3111775 RepID=A0ABU8I6B3_9SPHI|nr:hypothetical protein [Sphingobacterium sp. CZ-2]QBR11631.1 hypothetical protein E3D81_05370 [Sphingobacterium sp. CZ-2]